MTSILIDKLVVVGIYKRNLVWGVPGHEYIHLIQFLLDKGAEMNLISHPRIRELHGVNDDLGGTAFDLFAEDLLVPK